jgi:hypothetical protein
MQDIKLTKSQNRVIGETSNALTVIYGTIKTFLDDNKIKYTKIISSAEDKKIVCQYMIGDLLVLQVKIGSHGKIEYLRQSDNIYVTGNLAFSCCSFSDTKVFNLLNDKLNQTIKSDDLFVHCKREAFDHSRANDLHPLHGEKCLMINYDQFDHSGCDCEVIYFLTQKKINDSGLYMLFRSDDHCMTVDNDQLSVIEYYEAQGLIAVVTLAEKRMFKGLTQVAKNRSIQASIDQVALTLKLNNERIKDRDHWFIMEHMPYVYEKLGEIVANNQ